MRIIKIDIITAPMNYQQILPEESLQKYIRYFGILKSEHPSNDLRTFKILADGCPGMIFQENIHSFSNSNQQSLPQLFLHGLATKHSEKTTKGYFNNIGVYFQPDGLKSVFGLDAYELTDSYVDVGLICKSDLISRLTDVSSSARRIEIITDFIHQKLRKIKQQQPLNSALSLLKNNRLPLAEIHVALNVSERSAERMFRKHVGISPKLFSGISRFQMALQAMRKQNFDSLTDVAFLNGYADQSHFIREFREFAGSTPKQFLQHTCEKAENFPEWLP